MSASQHYTFGDGDVAAHRLALLADAYAPSSRAFMQLLRDAPARVAIDLGCGPGHTTALLAETLGAPTTIGLDNSHAHLARARSLAPPGVSFALHDLSVLPFPVPRADVLYGRFIVTHLRDAMSVVNLWGEAAVPRARLALEEVDTLAADDQVLQRYYGLVQAMQKAHGQRTFIGRELATPPAGSPWKVRRAVRQPIALPAKVAARLHALNFQTWRRDPFIAAHVPAAELNHLGVELEALASGAHPAPPVRWALAQVILQRR